MAIYDYRCRTCGMFEAARAMNDSSDPCCRECGGAAVRVFSAPNVSQLKPALSSALAREERSAHAPEVVQRPASTGLNRRGPTVAGSRPLIGHVH